MTTTTALTGYARTHAIACAALTVACPTCKSQSGQACTSTGGGNYQQVPLHAARRRRIEHWTEQVRLDAYAPLRGHEQQPWEVPAEHWAVCEAAAKPIPVKTPKQPTPKGVRLSEVQAEEIERAAANGGRTSASRTHFDGDAAERQTAKALEAKGILAEVGQSDDSYFYELTAFGWQVYRHHRLIIRRLPDDVIAARAPKDWAALDRKPVTAEETR